MKNLDDKNAANIIEKLNELYRYLYGKKLPIKKINFDKINIIYPHEKVKKYDIGYLKNKKNILSLIFANINQNPFNKPSYNQYAFEILWIILGVVEEDPTKSKKYRSKNVLVNVTVMNNLLNTIEFGKYIFNIPKYKKFIFDVKGYNLAKLKIM